MLKSNPIFKILNSTLVKLPTPMNISLWWNFGSLLALCLIIQVLTGLFLAFHYTSHIDYAFYSAVHIMQDANSGWMLRYLHANGASFFFICLYLHVGRGLYYGSYSLNHTWLVGVTLLLLSMATAFLGYVLPWGQMSLWGATVITNLLSSIPYVGATLVQWLWGGTSVEAPTLTRFFALHFLCPFIIMAFVVVHISLLHQSGSNNPLGIKSNHNKVTFYPYFIVKDSVGFLSLGALLIFTSLAYPNWLGDPENFNKANPIVSPIHIKPEWYYLFAYAILRAVPNKLGGVIALVSAIFILYTLPFSWKKNKQSNTPYPFNRVLNWGFMSVVFLLTWIGAKEVEEPYTTLGQLLTVMYFGYFMAAPILTVWWDSIEKV